MKIKFIQLIFVASCFFHLSCQPEGGTLIPILQDGARITSSPKQKDAALQYDTESFSMKVSGGWEPLYGDAGFNLIIRNKNPNKLKILFERVLLQSTLQELKVFGFRDRDTQSNQIIRYKPAEVGIGEVRVFYIYADYANEKDRIYRGYNKCFGNEISITIPITIEQNKVSTTTEYTFKFKYGELLPETEGESYSID
jgi:hypothetical protein